MPPAHLPARNSSKSKSQFMAAHSWRASEGKAVFVPLTLPGEQAARAHHAEQARLRNRRSRKRSLPPLRSASRPPALTSAPAAAATISTQTTRRSWPSSRPSCARPWSAAAFARPMKSIRAGRRSPGTIAIASVSPSTRQGNPGYRGRRSHAVIPIARVPHRRAAAGRTPRWRSPKSPGKVRASAAPH